MRGRYMAAVYVEPPVADDSSKTGNGLRQGSYECVSLTEPGGGQKYQQRQISFKFDLLFLQSQFADTRRVWFRDYTGLCFCAISLPDVSLPDVTLVASR